MQQNDGFLMLTGGKSRLININWSNDRFPDAPEMNARVKLTVMDAEGPGMITQIHATHYTPRNSMDFTSNAGGAIFISVWYDDEAEPAIEMPLMDFLGDCECGFGFYATRYFSKVKHSHNLYLPMPFEKHIRIELENRSDVDLFGYATIQYEALERLPKQMGYLRTQYKKAAAVIPDEKLTLFHTEGEGLIAAHWLRIEGDNPLCEKGEYLCEANDQIFIDDEEEPSLEYLGTEDYYGYSWGFHGIQSDGLSAITQQDVTPRGGALVGMLRCRERDAIRYDTQCRVEMDYQHEFFSRFSKNPRHLHVYPKVSFEVRYISCYYYYQR